MENKCLELSKKFWKATLESDTKVMREICHKDVTFVHIGVNANLEEECKCYDDKIFNPTNVTIHKQEVKEFGNTTIVLTDVDYGLLLNGQETTHHFMTTEVFVDEKIIQFTFTALVY